MTLLFYFVLDNPCCLFFFCLKFLLPFSPPPQVSGCLSLSLPLRLLSSSLLFLCSLFKGKKDSTSSVCLSDFLAPQAGKVLEFSGSPSRLAGSKDPFSSPWQTGSSKQAFQAQTRLDWIQKPNYHQKIKER